MSKKKQVPSPKKGAYPRDPALKRAVEQVGGWAALARGLRATRGAIWQWKRVPAERVLEVERVAGVPRYELRPDLYPRD